MHKVFSELQASNSDPYPGSRPDLFSHPNIRLSHFKRNSVSPGFAAAAFQRELLVAKAIYRLDVALSIFLIRSRLPEGNVMAIQN